MNKRIILSLCLAASFSMSAMAQHKQYEEEVAFWKDIVLMAYNGECVKEKLDLFTNNMVYGGYFKGDNMKVFKNVFGRRDKDDN